MSEFLDFSEFKDKDISLIIEKIDEALDKYKYSIEVHKLLLESETLTEDQEKEMDEALDKFVVEYNRINLEGTEEDLEKLISEGLIGSIIGGLAGFALGKTIGKAISKVLGIEKGILYDLLTSKLVGAAIGATMGKKI